MSKRQNVETFKPTYHLQKLKDMTALQNTEHVFKRLRNDKESV